MENQTETQIQQVKEELLVLKSDEERPLKMSGSPADREERAQTLVTLFVKFIDEHIDLLVQVRQDFFDKPIQAQRSHGWAYRDPVGLTDV